MGLIDAQAVLELVKPTRKKYPKKKEVKPEVIVVCGSTKWTDRKLMKKELAKIDFKNVRFVITGTSKGAELLCVSIAKELKMPVVQVHPLLHLGNSATYIRNNEVFSFFKPTRVIAFHKDIENSISTALYIKLAKKKGIEWTLIDGKRPAVKVAKQKAA